LKEKIIIGSRGSDLALWQANFVANELLTKCNIPTEIKIIKTKGDQIQHLSFDKMEGKGFFTKEIEDALLRKDIDIAVHSYKDLETNQPEGLVIGAVSKREDPSDLLLIRKETLDKTQKFNLKQHAVVGTSSSRRKSLMRLFRPDVDLHDLRGNVPTRIEKLRQKQYDAIILAKAGIDRLHIDISEFEYVVLNPKEFIPAPAQGILGIQARTSDAEILSLLKKISHPEIELIANTERAVLNRFGGGCQVPLGVYAEEKNNQLHIWVSRSLSWEKAPAQQFFLQNTNAPDIASIIHSFENIKPKNIFISSEIANSTFDKILSEYGFQCEGQSLIETEAIQIGTLPEFDWIFFSSKNAVDYFLKQYTPQTRHKIGAIGKGLPVN
jgi:hydroxymethylbilane synthase